MKTLKALVLEIFSVLLLLPALAGAAPALINYQGRLVDATGNPLSGTYSITFRIYDASSAGTLVWNETQSLSLDNGIFSASLGASTALAPSVFSSDTRYLEVQVGADSPMTPRIRLQSVPYAIYAASAAYAVGSDIADGQVTNAKIVSMAASKLTGALPAIDGSALLNVNSGSIVLPIVSTHMATGGIIAANIAADAVTTVKILDANVTSAKLASAIDAAKIGGGGVSTAEFDYLAGITSDVQAQINGKLSGTASISPTLIDLSTVTAALAGKLDTGAAAASVTNGVYTTGSYSDPAWITSLATSKINLSTVTAALAGKLDTGAAAASVTNGVYTTGSYSDPAWITSLATSKINLSTVTAALAAKLDSGATISPTLIDLSTVTAALAGKLDTGAAAASVTNGVYTTGSYSDPAWITSLATSKINLSTVTAALAGKLDTSGNGSGLTALTAANISAGSLGSSVIASSISVLSVYTGSIKDAAVTKAKIAADSCVNGEVLKLAGGVWTCGTDDTGAGGTVTGSGSAGQMAYWSAGSVLSFTDFNGARIMLGLVPGTSVQAYDADLTTYGGITPSANVQTLLGAANFAAVNTSLGLTIGTNVQAYDADLTTYGGITPSANIQTMLGSANNAAILSNIGAQAADADLTTYAGITPAADAQTLLDAPTYSEMQILLGLVPGTSVQAYDADLTTYGGITPSANVQTLLGSANNAAIVSNIGAQTADADLTTYAGITPSANVQTMLGSVNNAAILSNIGAQAADADLTTYAGITPAADAQTLLDAPTYSEMQILLGLVPGTSVQAYDADLTTYGGITPSANVQTMLGSANNAAIVSNIGAQAADADLTTYAGITPSANVQTLLGSANFAAVNTSLGLTIGTNIPGLAANTFTGVQTIKGLVSASQAQGLSGAITTFAADGSGIVVLTQTSETNPIATITGCDSGTVGQGQQLTFVAKVYTAGDFSFTDTAVGAAAADNMVLSGAWGMSGATGQGSTITLMCTTINAVKAWVEVSRSVNAN